MDSNGPTDILIVDDVQANLILFSGILKDEDLNIVTATSGARALELMEQNDFALLLLDVMMPGMDGFELAGRVRSDERWSKIPIIFITAISTDQQHVFRGYEVGAVDYLVKPVEPDVLKSKVRVFVELHRQRQALESFSRELAETVDRLKTSEAALGESEERYRIVAKQTGQIIYDHDLRTDDLGWWGDVERVVGHSIEEFQKGGVEFWKGLIHPNDLEQALSAREDARRMGRDYLVEYRLQHKDGRWLYIEDRGSFQRDDSGEPYRMLGSMEDITLQREARMAVAESNHFLQSVLDAIPNPVYYMNKSGEFELVNNAMEPVFGRSKVEILGRSFRDFHQGEASAKHESVVQEMLEDEVPGVRQYEAEVAHPGGEQRIYLYNNSVLLDMRGENLGVVSVMHDITDRKRYEEQIEYLAMHDPLTGLPNRMLFMDRLAQVVSHAKRNGSKAALLFMDLDGLKTINDSLGHEAGDAVLKVAASRLRRCLREADTAARIGGDEFIAILRDVHKPEDVDLVVSRITESLGEPFHLGGMELGVKASIGISVYPDNGKDVDTLINKADMAMYEVKREGGDASRYYEE